MLPLLRALDKVPKIGKDAVQEEMIKEGGRLSRSKRKRILAATLMKGRTRRSSTCRKRSRLQLEHAEGIRSLA